MEKTCTLNASKKCAIVSVEAQRIRVHMTIQPKEWLRLQTEVGVESDDFKLLLVDLVVGGLTRTRSSRARRYGVVCASDFSLERC